MGATASSLQVLLDSLAEESRRRLQEVVDDDDFDFYDEDFDEPPPESPPPTQMVSTRKVTLDVKTTHQVVVEGTPPSSPSTITSTSEVNVTVTSKSKNKRRKKKSKSQAPPSDQAPDVVDTQEKDSMPTSSKTEGQKSSKKKSKKKSQTVGQSAEKQKEPTTEDVSGSVISEESETAAKVVKSVEIDDQGVAYIKKTPVDDGKQDISITESVSGAVKRDLVQGQTSFSEDLQFKYNKQSFVSNSTQYHSPPENMLDDENIDKYLKSIEKEKSEVEAFLQSKSKQKQTVTTTDINLPQYIGKLLTMTRDSVDQLSVSDVTETSSEVSGSRKKKKKKSKKKSIESVSSSTSSEMVKSPSTEDSQVTVSLPSSGVPIAATPDSASVSAAQLSSSSSLDSKLKFSESSSNKESSSSDDSKPLNPVQVSSGLIHSNDELDSTAYMSLQDLSSRVPTKISYAPTSKSVNIHIDLSKLPTLSAPSETSDALIRYVK